MLRCFAFGLLNLKFVFLSVYKTPIWIYFSQNVLKSISRERNGHILPSIHTTSFTFSAISFCPLYLVFTGSGFLRKGYRSKKTEIRGPK